MNTRLLSAMLLLAAALPLFAADRSIVVTNTNDEGSGSLRQALLDAQQFCDADFCRIEFRITGTADNGRFVIHPLTELPHVRGRVILDGGTQTTFGGDTNPHGPEIVIDGSLVAGQAQGVVITGNTCFAQVLGLEVVDFPGPGIASFLRGVERRCPQLGFPGPPDVRIAGNHVSRNYRGVVVVDSGYTEIADNVITANRRAGIFAEHENRVYIVRNRITGNGASGVFLHVRHTTMHSLVEDNVISGNAEWGIARAPTGYTRLRRNAITGNRYLGIDVGLDFETPNRARDHYYPQGVPNKPVLISAQYDPAANRTRIRGRLDSESGAAIERFTIDVYASRSLSGYGQAEAERWVGSLQLPDRGGHADFELEVEGDLRGQYITATNTREQIVSFDDFVFDTSELSSAIVAH